MDEWRHYLLPISFVARTDHHGLRYLRTQKTLSERQWRWLAFFAQFRFELNYRPGTQMVVPDALSRKPKTELDIEHLLRMQGRDEDEPFMKIKVKTKDGKTQRVLMSLRSEEQIRVSASTSVASNAATDGSADPPNEIPRVFDYSDDDDYGEIFNTLSSGKSDPTRPSLQLYAIRDENLVWIDKRFQPRVCVPKKYRALILHEYHDTPLGAHFGEHKTYHGLKDRYIWPHLRPHVEQYVRSCDSCQKMKSSHKLKL
eukprot:403541-Hanusia_phi.AAC.1